MVQANQRNLVDFENDIFISFAHLDNLPLGKKEVGWIEQFHENLEVLLIQRTGERVGIWRDPKLQGNDYFNETILEQFPQVALLLTILSPRYVKSEWCMKELRHFVAAASTTGGVRLQDNKSRLFKVIKTYLPRDKHPPELQGLLGYEFFEFDQTGRPREFNKKFDSDWERKYWTKLDDLAHDISQLLKPFPQQEEEEESHDKSSGIKIYLAETTFELQEARDKIRRELQQRGYEVLPSQSLPYNPDCSEVIHENMEDCQLSIHLVGSCYGIIPETLEKSVEELQYAWAKEQMKHNSEFSYLVWVPNELQPEDNRQLNFIQCLKDDDETELLQTTLEDLKTIIQDKITHCQQLLESQEEEKEKEFTEVYLIYDQRDLDIIEPVEEYLWSQEWEVISPMFEGDEAELRQYHQESLRNCDAVLIHYGQGNERWLRTQLRELQKARGYGRTKPMLAKAIYVTGSETPRKKRFQTRYGMVIKNFAEFSPDLLEEFRLKLSPSQGGK